MQEVLRLHKELNLWVSNSRYQLQAADYKPIWRVQNTSMITACGAGAAAYAGFKRFRPKMGFPYDIVPPFVMYFLSYRVAQAAQTPGLLGSILALESPLGSTAREILSAMRTGGQLPSNNLDKQRQAQAASPMEPPRDDGIQTPAGGFASFEADDGAASTPTSPTTTAMPTAADPWDGSADGVGPADGASMAWGSAAPAADIATSPATSPPKRRSWDEIRAQAAQQGTQQR